MVIRSLTGGTSRGNEAVGGGTGATGRGTGATGQGTGATGKVLPGTLTAG